MRLCRLITCLLLFGCAAPQSAWRLDDAANADSSEITLNRQRDKTTAATIPTERVKKLLSMRDAMAKIAGYNPELHVVDGKDPNAFSGFIEGKSVIGFNLGMIELFQGDNDAYAAIMGHEFAHLALGHAAAGQAREQARVAGASIAGALLGIVGVPMGGSIAGLASQAVSAVYSRDDERAADQRGFDYMRRTGYDPKGAVRAWEKMASVSGFNIPFLSTHPTSDERLETMKRLAAQ